MNRKVSAAVYLSLIALASLHPLSAWNSALASDELQSKQSIVGQLPGHKASSEPIRNEVCLEDDRWHPDLIIERRPMSYYLVGERYTVDGELAGIRIVLKDEIAKFNANGIFSGDIVTSINDIEINSQKQGIRAIRNAKKATNIDLVLLRNGVQVKLFYTLICEPTK